MEAPGVRIGERRRPLGGMRALWVCELRQPGALGPLDWATLSNLVCHDYGEGLWLDTLCFPRSVWAMWHGGSMSQKPME